MNRRIFFWSVTSALAGFLFGFDTVVISGAEQKIQVVWSLSTAAQGFAVASALYGTVIGAMAGGYLSDRFGRRLVLVLIGMSYLLGAIWSALATDVYSFSIARLLGGVGIGVSTVAAPLYISEIAPARFRGRLAGMFQFNIVFGILIAYLSNALLSGSGPQAWRWMLAVAALPALIYTLLAVRLPESPRWLMVRKHDARAARRVLQLIDPQASDTDLDRAVHAMEAEAPERDVSQRFWSWHLRRPIVLALLIALFNQLSGINAILYFAPRIFALAGFGSRASLLSSVGIGLTNLLFTFLGLLLIDRQGRRTLLFIGSVGYVLSLSLVAWSFSTRHYLLVPIGIFAFIAAHAVGQGAVIWVFIAEIFPNRQRAGGQALGSSTHWIAAAVITTVFPAVVSRFSPASVFSFFAVMMALQWVWVKFMVVETKDVPLEQIQARLSGAT